MEPVTLYEMGVSALKLASKADEAAAKKRVEDELKKSNTNVQAMVAQLTKANEIMVKLYERTEIKMFSEIDRKEWLPTPVKLVVKQFVFYIYHPLKFQDCIKILGDYSQSFMQLVIMANQNIPLSQGNKKRLWNRVSQALGHDGYSCRRRYFQKIPRPQFEQMMIAYIPKNDVHRQQQRQQHQDDEYEDKDDDDGLTFDENDEEDERTDYF